MNDKEFYKILSKNNWSWVEAERLLNYIYTKLSEEKVPILPEQKTKRPMTDEEIFIALNKGAILKYLHNKPLNYIGYWNTYHGKPDYEISYDWKEKGLENATWQPLEVEE